LADSDRHSAGSTRQPLAAAKKLYGFLSRNEVLAAVYLALLCAAFLLETRLHRNLFYAAALPVFLVHLRAFDWSVLKRSLLAQAALAYLAYFLLSALWSDGLGWSGFADLLRITLLLLLFLLMTLRLATVYADFENRLFFWFAAVAGLTLLVVFAVYLSESHSRFYRLGGFGLAEHPIIGATLYGVALLAAAFVLLRVAKAWRTGLAWLVVILLCALFMLLSGSRGPLLALAAAVALGIAVADRRIAIALGAFFALVLAVGLFAEVETFRQLLARGPSGHFALWQQTLDAIAERPWLGYGSLVEIDFQGKAGAVRSPHNLLLANQLYGGLPAGLLLAALLLLALRESVIALRAGRPIYLVLLVFGLVAAQFDTRSLVQNLGREWITLWLPVMLLAAREAQRRAAAPPPAAS
jgi:O-antigen ligase